MVLLLRCWLSRRCLAAQLLAASFCLSALGRCARPSDCSPFTAHYRSGLVARCGWSDCGVWWGTFGAVLPGSDPFPRDLRSRSRDSGDSDDQEAAAWPSAKLWSSPKHRPGVSDKWVQESFPFGRGGHPLKGNVAWCPHGRQDNTGGAAISALPAFTALHSARERPLGVLRSCAEARAHLAVALRAAAAMSAISMGDVGASRTWWTGSGPRGCRSWPGCCPGRLSPRPSACCGGTVSVAGHPYTRLLMGTRIGRVERPSPCSRCSFACAGRGSKPAGRSRRAGRAS
jgi:hypothetical protein